MNENEGFGLGLSIAKRANGALALLENSPHGLIARVQLPLAASELEGRATVRQ